MRSSLLPQLAFPATSSRVFRATNGVLRGPDDAGKGDSGGHVGGIGRYCWVCVGVELQVLASRWHDRNAGCSPARQCDVGSIVREHFPKPPKAIPAPDATGVHERAE